MRGSEDPTGRESKRRLYSARGHHHGNTMIWPALPFPTFPAFPRNPSTGPDVAQMYPSSTRRAPRSDEVAIDQPSEHEAESQDQRDKGLQA